jgi:hypothetical protein
LAAGRGGVRFPAGCVWGEIMFSFRAICSDGMLARLRAGFPRTAMSRRLFAALCKRL